MLAGCAPRRQAAGDLAIVLARYAPGSAAPATAPAGPATQPVGAAAAPLAWPAEPVAPRTLEEYLRTALRENPEIRAALREVAARYERVVQVTALPDPQLRVIVRPEPVRTAEGDNYLVLGLEQTLPLPEKLDRAGRAALAEARMAAAALEAVRLRVIADVKRAYAQLYVIDRTIEVDRANQDLLRGLIEAARAQVATGRRSQDDVLRAQVELYTLESRIIELTQQRQTVAAWLNRLLNRPPQAPVPLTEPFEPRQVEARIETLRQAAEAHNPVLAQLRRQVERDRQQAMLAALEYWPDLTVGLEWMQMDPRGAFRPPPNPQTGMRPMVSRLSEAGTDNWAIMLRMNLPVWVDRIRARIREARQRLAASQHELDAARNRVAFEVADALARVEAGQALVRIFADTIIPQARQAFEVSRAAYSAGRSDFLFVIDNWQKWLSFTIQYHRAIGELERSVADLEQAVGRALAEVAP